MTWPPSLRPDRRLIGLIALAIVTLLAAGRDPVQAQGSGALLTVALLPFQDESGSGIPTLASGVSQVVRQKLLAAHGDTLPRLAARGAGESAGPASPEQLRTIGQQVNARFVVQGSILRAAAEPAGNGSKVTVVLFADVTTLATGETRTLRFDGSLTHAGTGLGIPDPAAVDTTSAAFAQTPLGQALSDAAAGLAEMIYKVMAGAVTAVQEPPAPPAAPPAEVPAAQQPPPTSMAAPASDAAMPLGSAPPAPLTDFEVQQLVADAQNVMAAYGGVSPQLADQVRAGLEQLNAALAQKADLLARGQDTQVVDADIARVKDQIRQSINALVQSQATGQAAGAGYAQPAPPSAGVMDRVDSFTGQTLAWLQKIQELRALISASAQANAAAAGQAGAGNQAQDPTQSQPVPQAPTEISGAVTQDGQPVGGVQVTETSTGATATTAQDGTYTLRGLAPGMLGQVMVSKQGKTIAAGTVQVLAGPSNLADFRLGTGSGTARMGLLGSALLPKQTAKNAGTLSGTVADAQGRPVPQALVTVAGIGMVRTDAQGRYLFAGLPAGTYQVVVRDARQGAMSSSVKVAAGRTPTVSTLTLSRTAGAIAAPTSPPISVPGDRNAARLQGRVRDQRNTDLPGVRINLLRQSDALSVVTAAGGRFDLHDIRPGPYRLVVTRPGYLTLARDLTLQSGKTENLDLKLTPTATLVDTLRVAAPPKLQSPAVTAPPQPIATTSRAGTGTAEPRPRPPAVTVQRARAPGQVAGHVVASKTGKGVPGATVTVAGRSATTDSQGGYRVENVAAGDHDVTVSRSGYLSQTRTLNITSGKAATADFKMAEVVPLLRK